MRSLFIILIVSTIKFSIYAQDFDGARPTQSHSSGINLARNYNTNIQLTAKTFGGTHGILFNAYYASSPVTGSLSAIGNTKYVHDVQEYGVGAGSIIFYGNGGTMDFLISPESTGANSDVVWGIPKLRLLRNGNVGIGTTSPDSKLTVAGKIHAQEIKVTTTAGADFVFEADYPLRSLEETEQFIKENKHLPDIPSAEEMVEEGITLGEMNVKLLQKIEELTLHQIKLLQKIKSLEKRIENL